MAEGIAFRQSLWLTGQGIMAGLQMVVISSLFYTGDATINIPVSANCLRRMVAKWLKPDIQAFIAKPQYWHPSFTL